MTTDKDLETPNDPAYVWQEAQDVKEAQRDENRKHYGGDEDEDDCYRGDDDDD
jgi:hypothetical protein